MPQERILVVDDEEAVRGIVAALLQRRGYATTMADGADTLDAMTSDRPYRKGTSFESASQEIGRCAGGQFDPAIVEVFLRIPTWTWSKLREEIARMSPAVLSARLCRPISTPAPFGIIAQQ